MIGASLLADNAIEAIDEFAFLEGKGVIILYYFLLEMV